MLHSKFQNAMEQDNAVKLQQSSAVLVGDLCDDKHHGVALLAWKGKLWKLFGLSRVHRWKGETAEQTE